MFGFQNMSYNSYENILLYCFYQFPEVFSFKLIMMFSDEANLTYIPLSSVIVLLIILLTCASRRRKPNAFSAVEKSAEDDMKKEYAIMCFPCLKKKPNENDFQPTTDLTDQFEYIVEKYTVRKVPLLLANTVEDVIERSEELEMTRADNGPNQPAQSEKDDFVNFQVAQEICSDQKSTPCITVAANTVCPAKKICKERGRPSDVLESMSPIPRPPIKNHNYVVIPTKGSLKHKDIMLTKREITTQYLNNFSSVFIDNLKDQVPKDPEQFPSLGRPYTSAFKNYPIPSPSPGKLFTKKSKKGRVQRVAYAFPSEKEGENFENPDPEEYCYDSDSVQDPNLDLTESEVQVDKNGFYSEASDTMTVSNGERQKDNFIASGKNLENTLEGDSGRKERIQCSPRNVTYEDIQSLDLGYEFSSSEKLGVKPKMTRIHYPIETDKLVETIKQLALSETNKLGKKNCGQDGKPSMKMTRSSSICDKIASRYPSKSSKMQPRNFEPHAFANDNAPPAKNSSSKNILTETCFLSKSEPASSPDESAEPQTDSMFREQTSTLTFTTKSLNESESQSVNDLTKVEESGREMADSVTEVSKLYDLKSQMAQSESSAELKAETREYRLPMPSKSRSFQESGRSGLRKELSSGNTSLPYNLEKQNNRMQESETETSYSLYSPDSKTSSAVTSVRSSEVEEGKRATLKWKIIIKHHRQNSSSKKIVKNFRADG